MNFSIFSLISLISFSVPSGGESKSSSNFSSKFTYGALYGFKIEKRVWLMEDGSFLSSQYGLTSILVSSLFSTFFNGVSRIFCIVLMIYL